MELFHAKIEIYDDDCPIAIIEATDDCSAKIQFDGFVNPGNWDEVSAEIRKALIIMFPENIK